MSLAEILIRGGVSVDDIVGFCENSIVNWKRFPLPLPCSFKVHAEVIIWQLLLEAK